MLDLTSKIRLCPNSTLDSRILKLVTPKLGIIVIYAKLNPAFRGLLVTETALKTNKLYYWRLLFMEG